MFYPVKTQKINDNVYAVRTLFVNYYIYTNGEDYICFDTGMSRLFAKTGLNRLGLNPNVIKHVFLTHTDYDHAGGLSLFKNAKVYISKDEEQMINGTTPRAIMLKHNHLRGDHTRIVIEDGEEINIGKIRVKAVSTPGHTPGSMSYIIDDLVIFAGDTMTLRKGKIYPFYPIQNMNTSRQKDSIRDFAQKYQHIPWVFTGHTGYSNNFPEAVKRWL